MAENSASFILTQGAFEAVFKRISLRYRIGEGRSAFIENENCYRRL